MNLDNVYVYSRSSTEERTRPRYVPDCSAQNFVQGVVRIARANPGAAPFNGQATHTGGGPTRGRRTCGGPASAMPPQEARSPATPGVPCAQPDGSGHCHHQDQRPATGRRVAVHGRFQIQYFLARGSFSVAEEITPGIVGFILKEVAGITTASTRQLQRLSELAVGWFCFPPIPAGNAPIAMQADVHFCTSTPPPSRPCWTTRTAWGAPPTSS